MTQTRDDQGQWAEGLSDVGRAFIDALATSRTDTSGFAADLVQRMEADAIAHGLIPDPNEQKNALREALGDLLAEQREGSTDD